MTTFSYDDYGYLRYALEVLRDGYIAMKNPKKDDAELLYIKSLDAELERRMLIMERRMSSGNKGQKVIG